MKVAICCGRDYRNYRIADEVSKGVKANGDDAKSFWIDSYKSHSIDAFKDDAEIAIFVGSVFQSLIEQYQRASIPSIFISEWWHDTEARVGIGIGATYPTNYLGKIGMPADRRIKRGWQTLPWRVHSPHARVVLRCLSDNGEIIRQIRRYTQRPVHIPVTRIKQSVQGAHCIITSDSQLCLHAMLGGVPVIALDEAISRNISSTTFEYIEYPYLAYNDQRMSWLNDLAYCQWDSEELQSGLAWQTTKSIMIKLKE